MQHSPFSQPELAQDLIQLLLI